MRVTVLVATVELNQNCLVCRGLKCCLGVCSFQVATSMQHTQPEIGGLFWATCLLWWLDDDYVNFLLKLNFTVKKGLLYLSLKSLGNNN